MRRWPTSRQYSLRHTFASMQSDAGTETTGLARLMGHTTTRTLKRYVSNTFEAQKAVTALQDRLNDVTKPRNVGDEVRPVFDADLTPPALEAKRTCDEVVASPC